GGVSSPRAARAGWGARWPWTVLNRLERPPRYGQRAPVVSRPRRAPLRRPWLWVLALLVAAEATVLVLLLQPHPASPPPGLLVVAHAPTLVRLQGEGRLTRPRAGEPVEVEEGVTLEPGDAIETGDSGRAALTWPGGAVATVDPQSSLLVRSAVDEPTPRLVLEHGGLWMDAGREPTALTVEALTPD